MRTTVFCLLILCTSPSLAQQPVAEHIIDVTEPLEQAIDQQLQTLKAGGRPEVLRLSDVLLYPFGVYQPVLTCTVLRACVVELEPGEKLISMIAGDDKRWLIDPTATGTDANTPLISVKPTSYNITTNLVVSTNRRVYHLTLDSPPKGRSRNGYNPLSPYTRHIRFYYPEVGIRSVEASDEATPFDVPAMGIGLGDLNYHYMWRREQGFPWEPLAIFDDGERVFIKLPALAAGQDQPLLTVGRKGEERIVNYSFRHGFYVVDGLFSYARLIVSHPAPATLFRKARQVQRALHIFPQQ